MEQCADGQLTENHLSLLLATVPATVFGGPVPQTRRMATSIFSVASRCVGSDVVSSAGVPGNGVAREEFPVRQH